MSGRSADAAVFAGFWCVVLREKLMFGGGAVDEIVIEEFEVGVELHCDVAREPVATRGHRRPAQVLRAVMLSQSALEVVTGVDDVLIAFVWAVDERREREIEKMLLSEGDAGIQFCPSFEDAFPCPLGDPAVVPLVKRELGPVMRFEQAYDMRECLAVTGFPIDVLAPDEHD